VVYDLNNINNLILAFKNGVYDFKNYEFRNALSSELITNTVNYDYEKADPQIKKELYNILADIFPDFEELSYLLKTISLGLVGTNIYKEIYVWTGNQGKTIIGNLTKSVLENYLRYFDPTYFKKKCDISLHLMVHLKDTRLLFIEENFAILNVDNLKKITNDTIQARNLFVLDGFNYTSKFKPILVTNSDINLDKYDQKLVERFRFISFPNIFVKEPKLDFERKVDIDLPEKLSDKKYSLAFLEILLDNYKDLIMYGLTIPKRFEQLNKKFFNKLI
jgi:phage/plasmid-associated DNA primase